jgi:hypothetical protein
MGRPTSYSLFIQLPLELRRKAQDQRSYTHNTFALVLRKGKGLRFDSLCITTSAWLEALLLISSIYGVILLLL